MKQQVAPVGSALASLAKKTPLDSFSRSSGTDNQSFAGVMKTAQASTKVDQKLATSPKPILDNFHGYQWKGNYFEWDNPTKLADLTQKLSEDVEYLPVWKESLAFEQAVHLTIPRDTRQYLLDCLEQDDAELSHLRWVKRSNKKPIGLHRILIQTPKRCLEVAGILEAVGVEDIENSAVTPSIQEALERRKAEAEWMAKEGTAGREGRVKWGLGYVPGMAPPPLPAPDPDVKWDEDY